MAFSREQKYALAVLTLINFFNYVDRQVIFPLFASIKQEFLITDFQLGLLGTVFMLVHSLASVPLGVLADKYSHKIIIASGVFFWSVVTLLSGFARSFSQLLSLRSLVGVGEASYAPPATAIISESFPQKMRSRVQGVFSLGMFAGGSLGAMLGGAMVFYTNNWRAAFFIVAIPGMLLALASARLKTSAHKAAAADRPSMAAVFKLWKNPAYMWLLISGTLITFSAGAFISWSTEFAHRYKGYNLRDAALILGSTMLLAGITGVVLGSHFADKAYSRFNWGRAGVIAASLTLAFPFIWLAVMLNRGFLFMACFFLGIALQCFYNGPVIAVIHDIVPRHIRATAFAIYLLVIHLLGDTLSPAIIGKISDLKGLQTGMEIAAVFILAAGLTFLPVCYYIKTKRTPIYTDEQNEFVDEGVPL